MLKKLVEDGFIIKTENVINGVRFCEYKAVVPELLPGTKCSGGRNKMFHNNIEYNTSNIYSAKFDKMMHLKDSGVYIQDIRTRKKHLMFLLKNVPMKQYCKRF